LKYVVAEIIDCCPEEFFVDRLLLGAT